MHYKTVCCRLGRYVNVCGFFVTELNGIADKILEQLDYQSGIAHDLRHVRTGHNSFILSNGVLQVGNRLVYNGRRINLLRCLLLAL